MEPVDSSPRENMNGFQLVYSVTSDDKIPIYVYKSTNSGITISIAEVDGPIVSGYFGIATEAHNDDGLPHTLEHLVFLGSEDYPYKGVLDLWANRCLASGTNAATSVDFTYYTMTTAGSEGFLSLLPVYLEHILYPTLTDSAYITEVHHIDGKGEDAGVIYCEMQGKENTGEYLVHTELVRAMFPGHCGYKSITGGALKNLRESTNNEKVKQFHKDFYRPENLSVIIVGQIKHADVFEVLQPLEQKILSKGNRGIYKKPWQSPVPAFLESKDIDVFYPCDNEDNGIINVAWRGPSVNNVYTVIACDILLKYLTDTSVSPLQKEFLKIDDPYASNITYFICEYAVCLLSLEFENVPKSKITLVKDQLLKALNGVYENGIDMKRMKTIINRSIIERLSCLETTPHNTIAMILMKHLLYGETKLDLHRRSNRIQSLQILNLEIEYYWLELLKKYFLDSTLVIVKGIPSLEKRHELTEKEKERVAKQIKDLGEEGLQLKAKELENAIAKNNAPVPDEILRSIPIPRTDLINFHQIKRFTTESAEQHFIFDLTYLPFYTYLDHVKTNFTHMFAIMNTSSIEKKYRPYIPLLLEAILESPIMRVGKIIPYEQIVAELKEDTIATQTKIGVDRTSRFSCGSYSHSAILMFHLYIRNYDDGVRYIKELLYNTILTSNRLQVIATKMVNDVAQVKRKGNKVVCDLMKGLLYKKDSNQFTSSMLRQQKFLTNVLHRLNDVEDSVISEIEIVRSALITPENVKVYIATDVGMLNHCITTLYCSWVSHFTNFESEKTRLDIIPDSMLINPLHEIPIKGCVTGLDCIESSYLSQCCQCINNYQHIDLAPLRVCLQYLIQSEGPMWRHIRRQGLSYGYNIHVNANEGLLYLTFYKSTNIVAAYKEAKSIVNMHITDNKWETLLFESAKSSLIFEIIEKVQNVGGLVQQSLLSYFKNVPHDYTQKMVQRISAVKIEDMSRIASKYLTQLFDPNECKTTIVCHPSKVQEIGYAFKALNHDLKLYNSLEESYLNDW